jgi:hypothetical protein
MRHPLHRIFRKVVFWVGDVRRLRGFPWITWDVSQHRIEFDEVLRDAIPKLETGDIVLHRDEGYLSNLFIGGFMIHAGIYVGDGYIVEAISEGVVKRHAAHILHSDYAMILRPKIDPASTKEDAIHEATKWAEKVVGCPYDELFDFDVAKGRKLLTEGRRTKLACTETPYLCYFDYRDALGIYRRRNINLLTRLLSWVGINTGKEVIDADIYVKANFEIVWLSKSITLKTAYAFGCDEAYLKKIENALWISKIKR